MGERGHRVMYDGIQERHQTILDRPGVLPESSELIEDHSNRPDICLDGVALCLTHLGCQVVGSAYECLALLLGVTQHLTHPEVRQFEVALFSEE